MVVLSHACSTVAKPRNERLGTVKVRGRLMGVVCRCVYVWGCGERQFEVYVGEWKLKREGGD